MSCTAESLRVTHINLTDPDPVYVAGAVNATTPLTLVVVLIILLSCWNLYKNVSSAKYPPDCVCCSGVTVICDLSVCTELMLEGKAVFVLTALFRLKMSSHTLVHSFLYNDGQSCITLLLSELLELFILQKYKGTTPSNMLFNAWRNPFCWWPNTVVIYGLVCFILICFKFLFSAVNVKHSS